MAYLHQNLEKPLCIIGAGDAAQSIYFLLKQGGYPGDIIAFLETDDCHRPREICGLPVRALPEFNPDKHQALLGIGSSQVRSQMVKQMPPNTEYARFIHPQNQLLSPDDFELGSGSIIFPYCIISRQVKLGQHSLILGHSILGHHGQFDDFFTAGARFNSGGHCQIQKRVFCGMSVSLSDRVHLGPDIYLGMGTVVPKSLSEPGYYWGVPAKWTKPLANA